MQAATKPQTVGSTSDERDAIADELAGEGRACAFRQVVGIEFLCDSQPQIGRARRGSEPRISDERLNDCGVACRRKNCINLVRRERADAKQKAVLSRKRCRKKLVLGRLKPPRKVLKQIPPDGERNVLVRRGSVEGLRRCNNNRQTASRIQLEAAQRARSFALTESDLRATAQFA
jgi:hypothetical protein